MSNGTGFFLRLQPSLYLVTAKRVLYTDEQRPYVEEVEVSYPPYEIGDEAGIIKVDLRAASVGIGKG